MDGLNLILLKKMKCLQKHVCHVQLSEALITTGTMGHSTVNFSKKQLADLYSKIWTRDPLGLIPSFDAFFRKIWLNKRLFPPPFGIGASWEILDLSLESVGVTASNNFEWKATWVFVV